MTRKSFAIRHLKLPTPDAQTIGKYLLHWHSRDLHLTPGAFPPIDSEHLFGNEQPLELEIGCGTGEYLCNLAAAHPDVNFAGADISLKSLLIAIEHAREQSLDNIKFIKCAIQLAYPLLVPGSLQAIYLHFPDPCLRPKHRKKRIFNQEFLDHAYLALTGDGRLSVMTDVPELFWSMLAVMEADPRFQKTHAERYLEGVDPSIRSRYQAIWARMGISPLRFEVKKRPVILP